MTDLKKLMLASKTLPPGHYDIKKAQEALAGEYEMAHNVSRRWAKKLPSRLPVRIAQQLCGRITQALGIQRLKAIVLNSEDVGPAAAHYDPRTKAIHFPSEWISTTTFLHELAHHVHHCDGAKGSMHGEEFCALFDLTCEAALAVGLYEG